MTASKKISYKQLKMKAGLEIHQQLDTRHKLFCDCSTVMVQREPIAVMRRKQHPVTSELGEVDIAAQFEYLRDRTFHYQILPAETCLVETDSEPPHNLNPEALRLTLQIALLLNCQIPNEIHIMRKTVINGSNTAGFQRTAIVGLNGYLRYKGKKVEITHVALEEDAAAIIRQKKNEVTYRLNRLGVPLIEIGTGILFGYNPEEIQEIAYLIGIICRSIGKVKHGIGSIRQDINVSIRNGPRVEIKGVQELGLLAKVVEKEVQRQVDLGKKVKHETRSVNVDGSTYYTRPLPGAARMYPETDIRPVVITKGMLKEVKASLPEPFTKKLSRFQSKFKLPRDLAVQIIRSDHLELFEKIAGIRGVDAKVVANTFVSTLKDLRKRKEVKTGNLTYKHFIDIFQKIARRQIVKESIPNIIEYLADKPLSTVTQAVAILNLKMMGRGELRKIINQSVKDNPELSRDKIYGIVMSRVRGRADPQEVFKLVKSAKRK